MGPYTIEQINEYLGQGSLLPTDYAWHEGLPDWVPVTQISGVGPAASPPPFNPAQAPAVAPEGNAKKKKLMLIGGIAGGVALIAVLALVLLKGSGGPDPKNMTPQEREAESSRLFVEFLKLAPLVDVDDLDRAIDSDRDKVYTKEDLKLYKDYFSNVEKWRALGNEIMEKYPETTSGRKLLVGVKRDDGLPWNIPGWIKFQEDIQDDLIDDVKEHYADTLGKTFPEILE